jgi:hypothetical protein
MRNQTFLAALFLPALAGMALLAPAAYGQSTITPNATGDMILGFQVETLTSSSDTALSPQGPGSGENLEIDLGSASQFYSATPGTSFTLPKLAVADLIATYGASWYTRTDLDWGIIGTTGRFSGSEIYSGGVGTADGYAAAKTIWATRAESIPGTQSVPWTDSLLLSSPISLIEPLYTGGSPLLNATSTVNSAYATVVASTTIGSWTTEDGAAGTTSFNYFHGSIDNTTDIPASGEAISDLYQVNYVNGGSAQLLGNFELNNSGLLTYNAVPEPSSLALLGVTACAFTMLLRRRRRGTNQPMPQ